MTHEDALFAVLSHGDYPSEIVPNEEAVAPPPRWAIVREALMVLDRNRVVQPADASFVGVVTAVDAQDWTPPVVERAYALVTGPYREVLEEQGWDVDLFPSPTAPARPSSGFRAPRERVLAGVRSGGESGDGSSEPMTDRMTSQRNYQPSGERQQSHVQPGEQRSQQMNGQQVRPAGPPTQPAQPRAHYAQATAPPPVAPTAPANVPSGVPSGVPADAVTVTGTPDGNVALFAPVGHPARDTARTLPGARWNGTTSAWEFPIARETALALRTFLTGYKTAIDRDVAMRLKAAADAPAEATGPAITVNGERIEIRFPHTPARQDDVKRHAKATWDGPNGCWVTTTANAAGAIQFAQAHGLGVAPEVEAAAAARFEPFDYDGTIDGLRGVPVSELHFVRAVPARGKTASLEDRLAEYGIETVFDLLNVVPFRYMDRSHQIPIRDLKVGEQVGFLARVTKVGQYDRVKRMVRFTVADGTGELSITFFNAAWMAFRFRVGDEVVVYGRLDVWNGGGRSIKQMSNPIMDPVGGDTAMIVPVYPQSEKSKVTTWDLHGAAMEAVRRLGELQDPFPEDLKAKHQLMSRLEAYQQVHAPESVARAEQARTRLAFDELFRMQLALGMRRHATADEVGVAHKPTGVLISQFLGGLRFEPTGAQKRALAEIKEDLLRPHPMHRLLQGDVGAGKSLVAMTTLLMGTEGGYQGALMAPTEILATQLHAELRDELAKIEHPDGRPLVVDFLGGKTRVKEKRRILAGLADGSVDIVVGTHALLTDEVEFANLGVVVIDEQHRFGVEQRAALRGKGRNGAPDMLVMTATPIPRTAAMTVFGDLSVSVLNELPPGRTPIATSWIPGEPELDVITGPPWDVIRSEVEAGRQAYVVASLVEDNEKIAAASAEAAMESLQHGALVGLRLGLVHGKQPREEREATMQAFKRGELDVLVATTVIEVGVNVPNATVMVVLDATRFGIAQLHQIRGRVGRGKHASRCILTGKAGSGDAVQRMNALVASTDGFYLSEVDLNLRGEGSLFGSRQSGQTDLRVASLKEDRDILITCRNEADRLLDGDPKLLRRPGLRAEVRSAIGEDAEAWLTKS